MARIDSNNDLVFDCLFKPKENIIESNIWQIFNLIPVKLIISHIIIKRRLRLSIHKITLSNHDNLW